MANIITSYDQTLKEKVFIVRGEEGYARSTDCMLTELLTNNGERRADWDMHLDYMLLEFRIDVVRDIGASEIVLYDNDEPIGVYEFNTNSHYIDLKFEDSEHDNRLMLNYDVEHNIYAKYMGNKQCLKSQSKTYTFYEKTPDAFECSLSFLETDGETPLSPNFNTGDDVEFKVLLDAQEYNVGRDIEIYLDGEKVGSDRTTTTGGLTPTITLSDVADGKHTLTARFNGYKQGETDYLIATSSTMDISVGYIATISSYAPYVINSQPSSVRVSVVDHLGEFCKENGVIYIGENDPFSPISPSASINKTGVTVVNNAVLTSSPFKAQVLVDDGSVEPVEYYSETATTNVYPNAVVSFTQPNLITSTNNQLSIQGQVQSVSEPVTVDVTGVGIINTSANGSFSTFYEGMGAGDVSISASIYGSSATIQIEDLFQYWKSPNKSMNYNFQQRYGSITAVSNGWKCSPRTQSSYRFLGEFVQNDVGSHFYVEFKLVSVPSAMGVGVGADSYIGYNSKKGDVIKIETNKNTNTTILYINNEHQYTYDDFTSPTGAIGFLLGNSTQSVIIDEVKLKRL